MSAATDLKVLGPVLEETRQARGTLVLATMVETAGSSYRKAGARMLMSPDGRWWGLLGGGCFEGDLVDRALDALAGPAQIVEYDLRGEHDDSKTSLLRNRLDLAGYLRSHGVLGDVEHQKQRL
jgi:hypothetical protein